MGVAPSRQSHTHTPVPVQHIDPDDCALTNDPELPQLLFSAVPNELRDLLSEVSAATHAKGRYDVVIAYLETLEAAPRPMEDVRRDLTDICNHAKRMDRL